MRDMKTSGELDARMALAMKLRVFAMGTFFFVFLVILFGRAVQLQVRQNGRLLSMAQDQYLRNTEELAVRGEIQDRNSTVLAQTVEVESIAVDPSKLENQKKAAAALGKVFGVDQKELLARFSKAEKFAWVKRQVKPAEAAQVRQLGLKGIVIQRESQRFYPYRELASHLVGMVGQEGKGLDGVELSFEDDLMGVSAKRSILRDARGRKLFTKVEGDHADHGASVVLTIDRTVQFETEKALEKAVADAQAIGGMALALDVKTGEVLSIANLPRFNPNDTKSMSRDSLRNRAVTDTFEPGSTFKSFVVAEALERKVITPQTSFDCEKGRMYVGKNPINDSHPHGILSTKEILQVSSNIGAAKIAQKLGREALHDAYERFGFGEKIGLGLPSEGKGSVPFPKAEITLATQSFGQGLSATVLQLAAAYGALANQGVLMRPYLVSKVVDGDQTVLLENKPTPVRRVVSAQTAQSVISMLESVVVKGGTAPKAALEEYRVAGKTGTAQKPDPIARGYSDKRIGSFIGIVPADAPKLVIVVVIDEPKTDVYGGIVAAPAFKQIAEAVLPRLGIKPSQGMPREQLLAKLSVPTPTKTYAAAPVKPELAVDSMAEAAPGMVKVPDVLGRATRQAVAALLGTSLSPRIAGGSGVVTSQVPSAGASVAKGTVVVLDLSTRE